MEEKSKEELGGENTNLTPLTDKQISMLDALEKYHGVISPACRKIGISRATHYEWMKNENYASAFRDIKESAIDFVENKMFDRISEGSDPLIKWYLGTIGRKRGYIENQEKPKDTTIINIHNGTELPDEE